MRKQEREIYNILANEVEFVLCSFCKYAECIACGEPECKHPLEHRFSFAWPYYGMEPGQDCWGFRSAHDITTIADIVGIILDNGWEVAGWHESKEGQLVVTGTKDWV